MNGANPVTSIDDPDLNVRQFFTLTEVRGPRRTGARTGTAPAGASDPNASVGARCSRLVSVVAGVVIAIDKSVAVLSRERKTGTGIHPASLSPAGRADHPESARPPSRLTGDGVRMPEPARMQAGATRARARRRARGWWPGPAPSRSADR